MSGETTTYKFKFAEAADEVNKFPVNVDEPKTKEIDKVLTEKILRIKKRAASYNAETGELGLQESNAKTTTLPAAAPANQIIGVTSLVAEAKVTTSGGAFIYGKWLTVASATATVILTEDMTAYFQSDGTNWNLWGEIKDERKYSIKAFTKAEMEAGVTLSAIRDSFIEVGVGSIAEIGGIGNAEVPITAAIVPAGQVIKGTLAVKATVLLR